MRQLRQCGFCGTPDELNYCEGCGLLICAWCATIYSQKRLCPLCGRANLPQPDNSLFEWASQPSRWSLLDRFLAAWLRKWS